jgi:hypothetical protein
VEEGGAGGAGVAMEKGARRVGADHSTLGLVYGGPVSGELVDRVAAV